jgi:long-chain acyl-CoA synthetase
MPAAALTLREVLNNSARTYPDRTALTMIDGACMTYRELHQQSGALSRFLAMQGIGFGDRVAILGENMTNWGVAYFAITAMGAVAVPILPDFHSSDIMRILLHAEPKAIFVSRRLFEKLEVGNSGGPSLTILLNDFTIVPQGTSGESLDRLLADGSRAFAHLAVPSDAAGSRPEAPLRHNDLAVIVYTSGTTGHSKGVMLTHGNLVSDAEALIMITGVNKDDRLLSILPLPHTYECTIGLITPVLVGASVYYLDKPPSAGVLLPALARIQPTIMLSVPLVIEKIYKGKIHPELTRSAMLRKLLEVGITRKLLHRVAGRKLLQTFGGKLRIFAIGGAPLAPDVESFLREAGFPYAIGYGLTETAPLVAGTPPWKTRYRSTGPALPGTQIRIDNPDPVTGEGEILIKGPTVMQGYYKDPERTREVFTGDGWLKTGDLGVLDRDNYLYIKGRLKNMILGPSGKNIYPEEIEAIINEFDSVSESIVYEHQNRLVALVHPDYEKLQQAIHSFSDSDLGKRMTAMMEDLRRQINERVPQYARLHKLIEHAEPFEKTPTQKIKRHLYLQQLKRTG